MLDYDLTGRALRDIRAAREWYDQRDVDLGNSLLGDLLNAIKKARQRPLSFPVWKRGVRRILCRRFPFHVYFKLIDETVVVLAVYHTARDPGNWNDPDRT